MSVHLFVAHFPIALFVVGAGLDLAGALLGSDESRRWGGVLLILGAASALMAFLTGQGALSALLLRSRPDPALLEAHTQWGGAGVWAVALAGMLRALWRGRHHGVYGWANLLVAIAAALVVVAITASGMAIAHAR